MIYFLAFLIVIIRVFGFTNTVNFVSKALNLGNQAKTDGRADLKQTLDKMFAKKAQSGEIKAPKNVSREPSNTTKNDHRFGEMPARKLPPRRKNRGSEPRFVQNAGRTSQEILAGRPDFGWRRVY